VNTTILENEFVSVFCQSIGTHLQVPMQSRPRKLQSEHSLPWKRTCMISIYYLYVIKNLEFTCTVSSDKQF